MWYALLSLLPLVGALSTAQLRDRSVYQVLTDRFARPDGRSDIYCEPAERVHCGGGWRGIENQLDYIQGMGFDTGKRCRGSH